MAATSTAFMARAGRRARRQRGPAGLRPRGPRRRRRLGAAALQAHDDVEPCDRCAGRARSASRSWRLNRLRSMARAERLAADDKPDAAERKGCGRGDESARGDLRTGVPSRNTASNAPVPVRRYGRAPAGKRAGGAGFRRTDGRGPWRGARRAPCGRRRSSSGRGSRGSARADLGGLESAFHRRRRFEGRVEAPRQDACGNRGKALY